MKIEKIKIVFLILSSIMLSSCLLKAPLNDATVGENIDDESISAKIKSQLMKEGFKQLYTKIDVSVSQGRVMYTGSVGSEDDMMKAVEIAWDQNGVKEVINNLDIDSESNKFNLAQYSKDTYLTSVVRTRLLGIKEVKSPNYTIVTHKNIVYIFGIARSESELELVANTASKVAGVEKVVSQVKIQEPRPKQKNSNER